MLLFNALEQLNTLLVKGLKGWASVRLFIGGIAANFQAFLLG